MPVKTALIGYFLCTFRRHGGVPPAGQCRLSAGRIRQCEHARTRQSKEVHLGHHHHTRGRLGQKPDSAYRFQRYS